MQPYVIFTESTGDLTPALIEAAGLQVLPMSFNLDGTAYRNWPDGREMSSRDFYDKLRAGSMSTTSQINSAAFIEAFTPVLAAGKDILYVAFSSGLSGTYQSACLAADDLREQFPERTIECVDTLQASMGEGLAAYTAAMLKKSGMGLTELAAWIRDNAQRFCAWFTVDDLMFLKRGGRLSGVAAVAGTLLGIKPVLHVDPDGHLVAMEKVRGRKASLDALVRHFEASAEDHAQQTVFISHGDCEEDCRYVADKIKAFGVKRICIGTIGPVIGAHSGPGTVALFFTGSPR